MADTKSEVTGAVSSAAPEARPVGHAVALQPQYASGVAARITATEVQLVFTFGNIPKQVILLPFGTAKALGAELDKLMRQFEKDVGVTFPLPKDMEAKIREVVEAKKAATKT